MPKKTGVPLPRERLLKIIAIIFAALFILYWATFPIQKAIPEPEMKILMTRGDLTRMAQDVMQYEDTYGKLQPTLDNAAIMELITNNHQTGIRFYGPRELNSKGEAIDPWGTPYRISLTDYIVRSAGPDKQWGTADDLSNATSP